MNDGRVCCVPSEGDTSEDQVREIQHIKSALRSNEYAEWVFKTTKNTQKKPTNMDTSQKRTTNNVGLPYISGVSENSSHTSSENMG